MSKKDYLNSIKSLNNERILEIQLTIKSIGEAIDQANRDIETYNAQQLKSEQQISQLTADNLMLDEIIAVIPDDSIN